MARKTSLLAAAPKSIAMVIAMSIGVGLFAVMGFDSLQAEKINRPENLVTKRPPVTLLQPADGATMQRKDLRFAWAQIPGVEEYGLFISSTPFTIDKYGVLQGGSLVIKAKRGDPPVWEPDFYYPELKAGHTYYWAIISDIEEPAERRASKVKSFTIGLKPAMASVDRTSNLPKMSAGLASKFSPEVSQNANLISAGGGFTIDTKVGEPKLPQELTGSAAKAGERGYYIVHFNGPIYPQMKEALEKSGAIVYDYLPNYAFIVGMDENIKARVKNIPSCDWTGLYQPAYKFSQEDMDRHLTVNKSTNRAEVVIRFFTEEDLGKNIASLEGMGVKVLKSSESEFNKIARAEVDASKISDIARLPGVCFIEPFVIHKILNNLSIRYMSSGLNTADTTIYTKGVKGQGEIVNISDTGIRMTHQNFKDPDVSVTADGDYTTHRKVIAYKVWKPATFGDYNDGHGTHTVGTICGYSKYGSVTVDSMPGMAKLSKIYFQDVGKADTLYGLPDDLTLLFKQSYTGNSAGGARVSSHSWGSSNHTYTGYCRDVDIFTWKYQDFAVFFSAGNSAGAVDADSIGSPARAKNTVAVGSVGARATGNADDIPGYSSRGRTKPDGRYKPDILAVGGMASFTEAGPYSADGGADAAYVRMSGTSMASPCAAGMGALVRQYFREGWYPTGTKVRLNGFIPSGALIHAVEVASGDTNLSSNAVLPNGAAGWGRIDIDSALYFSGDGRKLLVIDNQDGLITGDAVSYRFNVPSSAANLKIVLVWHDYPAAVGATLPLVNDLNLEVNGAGTIYWGNRYTSGQSTANPTGKRDTANIVEVVRLKAPAAGAWVATINGNNIPYGAQPFALVVVYTQSQFAASVRLDRTRYSVPAGGTVGDTVRIAVVDSFGTATAVDTALVAVWSKYETSPDTVKCIEDTANGNYFIGKIPLRTIAAKHNDGYLSVEQSDSVFASFTDASPAFTDTARARVDLINFVITNVRAENVFNAAADIKWTTSEAATSTVYYDTLTSVGKKITDADQDIPAGEVLSHVITLKGLTPNRLYYYDVESKDHAGNMVRDNNGGRHYTFTTTNNWDVLYVDGSGYPVDVRPAYQNALAKFSWGYDSWLSGRSAGGQPDTAYMNKFKCVIWSAGWYLDPEDTATVKNYMNGPKALLGMFTQDTPWYYGSGDYYGAAFKTYLENVLHTIYRSDPVSIARKYYRGYASDPISDKWSGTKDSMYIYCNDGMGGNGGNKEWGDFIKANTNGVGFMCQDSSSSKRDTCGIRWTSGGDRLFLSTAEFANMNDTSSTGPWQSADRDTFMNKAVLWLLGRTEVKPVISISVPAGGNTYTSSPISITWSVTYGGSLAQDSTFIYYSDNNGDAWYLITKGVLTSPYAWDITARLNGAKYKIKVVVRDNGTPKLTGETATGAFTINRSGNDTKGPVMVRHSMKTDKNPVPGGAKFRIDCTASDSLFGLSNIQAVKCSLTGSTVTAPVVQNMKATDGTFNAIIEQAFDSIATETGSWSLSYRIYFRAQDASAAKGGKSANNWGGLDSNDVVIAGGKIPNAQPLAVTLTLFTAQTAQPGVVLTWTTASEINSLSWQVERSLTADGDYQKIAEMPAAGNSNQVTEYTYTDLTALPNQGYYYKLVNISKDEPQSRVVYGPIHATAGGIAAPKFFALQEARPNPFGGMVDIGYQLPEKAQVSLKIYNIAGQVVRTFEEGLKDADYYTVVWNGKDDNGKILSNGVYIYRLSANTISGRQYQTAKKVTLLK